MSEQGEQVHPSTLPGQPPSPGTWLSGPGEMGVVTARGHESLCTTCTWGGWALPGVDSRVRPGAAFQTGRQSERARGSPDAALRLPLRGGRRVRLGLRRSQVLDVPPRGTQLTCSLSTAQFW